jgi:hypothetical protein
MTPTYLYVPERKGNEYESESIKKGRVPLKLGYIKIVLGLANKPE